MPNALSNQLLSWYADHGRSLPWRERPEPYAVWISEIMAQQTRLETVLPYYRRWMTLFPDIATLAAASQQDVLNAWEGLGYYSRARNLHKAAGIVVREHGGQLPADPTRLQSLPGIGRYTAGAVASIAFGRDEPVVDGNVKRVYARLFLVEEPINTPQGEQAIWSLAAAHLPAGQAGNFNQALMDLGALVCLPKQPDCPACPLNAICLAAQQGKTGAYPRKKPRPEVPHYTVTAAVIRDQHGQVLLTQRPENVLLGGLWEFPGGKQEAGETLKSCLKREIREELACTIDVHEALGIFRHAYTHFKVTLHAFHARLATERFELLYHQAARWVPPELLDEYPMGKIDRMIARQLQDNTG
jgi:A/G-specific adenine glycosylase